MDVMKLFSCLLVFYVGAQLGEAAECMPDPVYLCTARCNGTSFDLSKAFDFPLKITESTYPFSYVWNPCHVVDCPGYETGTDCAVCQSADRHYVCGKTSTPIWLLDDWASTNENFPNWQVEYTFGTSWRISIFKFIVDHKVEKPIVKFISEEPELQYNFEVRGKCIGQESYDCQQYYESRSKK